MCRRLQVGRSLPAAMAIVLVFFKLEGIISADGPPSQSEAVELPFGIDGDVNIGALLPLYEPGPGGGSRCTSESFFPGLIHVQPIVSMLRRRHFQLTAKSRACSRASSPASSCVEMNVTLGYSIYDTCGRGNQSVSSLVRMLQGVCDGRKSCSSLSSAAAARGERTAAIIGPMNSVNTQFAAPLASAYETPIIAPLSRNGLFRCDADGQILKKCEADYQYLYRMVPSDTFAMEGIAALVKAQQEITYVGVINVAEDDYRSSRRTLVTELIKEGDDGRKVCFAFQEEFRNSEAEQLAVFGPKSRPDSCSDVCKAYKDTPSKRPNPALMTIIDSIDSDDRLQYVVVLANDIDYSSVWGARIFKACKCGQEHEKVDCDPPPREITWISYDESGFLTFDRIRSDFWHKCAGVGTVLRVGPTLNHDLQSYADGLLKAAEEDTKSFMVSPTAKRRQENPFLCHNLDIELRFNGLCQDIGVCNVTNEKGTCDALEAKMMRQPSPLVLLGDYPETYLGTDIVLAALQDLLQEFVDSPLVSNSGDRVASFRQYALGLPLLKAIGSIHLCLGDATRLSTGQCPGESYNIFLKRFREVDSDLTIRALTVNSRQYETDIFTFHEVEDVVEKFANRSEMAEVSWSRLQVKVSSLPSDKCHPYCGPGFHTLANVSTCCYVCVKCENRTISSVAQSFQCTACELGTQPNPNQTECVPFRTEPFPNSFRLAVIIFVCILTLVLVLTLLVLIHFRDTPIAKSSGRSLTFAILGMLICGSLALLIYYADPPTKAVCRLRSVVSTLLVLVCATILVKTSLLARIATVAGKRSLSSKFARWNMSNSAQVVKVVILVLIPVCVNIYTLVWTNRDRIIAYVIGSDSAENFGIYVCPRMGFDQVAVDIYLGILGLATAMNSFLIRKLPVSFNETRYLFLATLTTSLTYLPLTATYLLVTDRTLRYIEFLRVLVFIFLIWAWMFVPRLYILLLRPEKNRIRLPSASKMASEKQSKSRSRTSRGVHSRASLPTTSSINSRSQTKFPADSTSATADSTFSGQPLSAVEDEVSAM